MELTRFSDVRRPIFKFKFPVFFFRLTFFPRKKEVYFVRYFFPRCWKWQYPPDTPPTHTPLITFWDPPILPRAHHPSQTSPHQTIYDKPAKYTIKNYISLRFYFYLIILLFNQGVLLIVCFHIFQSFKANTNHNKGLENYCVKTTV